MALSEQLRQELHDLVHSHDYVLFMKGTPERPQCGFSATVAGMLDEVLEGYKTVNVLERGDLREGIKEYGNWPTIPQLYVKGELVGGADIVKSLAAKGELTKVLGVTPKAVERPVITVTPTAVAQLEKALADEDVKTLRFSIDRRFQYGLDVDAAGPDDFEYPLGKVSLAIDKASARRADGVVIDFIERGLNSGFKIENPNAPPGVKSMTAKDLKAKLDAGVALHVFDVRTPDERARASIPGTLLLDAAGEAALRALPKDAAIVFHCHHGGRSLAAAQHYLEQGYKNVTNLEGGIASWSRDVDPSVPQY